MGQHTILDLTSRIEKDMLDHVSRPARYIGGEVNQIRKDLASCDVKVALCFPDVYEVGMSYTGIAILYWILNNLDGVAAERVFAPWLDAEAVMRSRRIPLFTLESKAPVVSFDIIGFSLTTELCYTNVLNMIDLAGLAIHSSDRGPDAPLIIAGGIMAGCAEPMADFIDLFVIGDGEEAVVKLVQLLRESKKAGTDKAHLLYEAARRFPWAYVPALYRVEWKDGQMASIRPTVDGVEVQRSQAVVQDLDSAPVPTRPIVPFVQAVHERINLEIMRGCPGRCRFCQASFCKRPIRFRSPERIIDLARASYHSTGLDTICLLSLSSSDYPDLYGLITTLNSYFQQRHVGISVPSLRVDKDLRLIPHLLTSVRKSGLTLAVEAASERLRSIINKPIKDSHLFDAAKAAYDAGWQRLKLYFMVGLPGERPSDLTQIVDLAASLAGLGPGRPAQVACTVSWLVPKPHTPFGLLGQRPRSYLEHARTIILQRKAQIKANSVYFRFHSIERSILESALGRGDRRLGPVIEAAWRAGARFDLWDECLDYQIWQKAAASYQLDLEALVCARFEEGQLLPWEHLGGPEKSYLLDHLHQAVEMAQDTALS